MMLTHWLKEKYNKNPLITSPLMNSRQNLTKAYAHT